MRSGTLVARVKSSLDRVEPEAVHACMSAIFLASQRERRDLLDREVEPR
jgi:hypothetical protein